jgi:hypothetical protein
MRPVSVPTESTSAGGHYVSVSTRSRSPAAESTSPAPEWRSPGSGSAGSGLAAMWSVIGSEAMVHVSAVTNPNFHATGSHYLNADTTAFIQLVQTDLFKDFPDLRLIIRTAVARCRATGVGSADSRTC